MGLSQNKRAANKVQHARAVGGGVPDTQVDKVYLILCSVLLKGLLVFDDKVRLEGESSLSG